MSGPGVVMSALTTLIMSPDVQGPLAPLDSTENLPVNARGCVRKEATYCVKSPCRSSSGGLFSSNRRSPANYSKEPG